MQFVMMTMDAPSVATAPPPNAAFEIIVQSVAVNVDVSLTATAPPSTAVFEVIVQSVAVTVESSSAQSAPPRDDVSHQDLVSSLRVTDRDAEQRPTSHIRDVGGHRAAGCGDGGVTSRRDGATYIRRV